MKRTKSKIIQNISKIVVFIFIIFGGFICCREENPLIPDLEEIPDQEEIPDSDSTENVYYGLEGWAAKTVGGQGGQIIKVTNLNASGSGSLADALQSLDKRVVVFEVGGIVDLQGGTIRIENPFITVAGQTAPSPGITLINGTIGIGTHDVLLQHLRMRVGAAWYGAGWEPDGISAISASNVVIDHCSISWAVDENCSASGPRFEGLTPDDWRSNTSNNITMSNNIIAEGLSNATHGKGEHSKGSLIHDNTSNIAVLKNLYISNMERSPLIKGGAQVVVANNYIHNPGTMCIRYALNSNEWEGHSPQIGRLSIVGNVLQYGPSTASIPLLRATGGVCKIYLKDNVAKDQNGLDVTQYIGDASNIVKAPPIWNDNLELYSTDEVQDYIVVHAGATPWDRDETDTRLINEMLSGGGKIIDYETEVGGYPTATPTARSFDSDDWNMNFMIAISPNLSVSTPSVADTVMQKETFAVQVEAAELTEEVEFVELLVNQRSLGKQLYSPYEWQVQPDSLGRYNLLVIAETKKGRLWASETVKKVVVSK